jgi:hypothetical protein
MFYFIPVKINRRRYFVAQLKHNNTHTHHFIIRKGQPDVFALFNAGSEWKHLYSSHGPDKDVVLQFRAHTQENTLVVELLDKQRVEKVAMAAPQPETAVPETAPGEAVTAVHNPNTGDEDEDSLNSMIRSIFGRSKKTSAAGSSTVTGAGTGMTETNVINRESLDQLSAAARNMGFDIGPDYLLRNRSYSHRQLTVVLQYTDADSDVYRASLCFHFQQDDHPVMYHMVDFGSEASQIARCYPDRDQSPATQYNI